MRFWIAQILRLRKAHKKQVFQKLIKAHLLLLTEFEFVLQIEGIAVIQEVAALQEINKHQAIQQHRGIPTAIALGFNSLNFQTKLLMQSFKILEKLLRNPLNVKPLFDFLGHINMGQVLFFIQVDNQGFELLQQRFRILAPLIGVRSHSGTFSWFRL